MNNWCICWFFTHIFTLLGILIFKRLTARRLYKSFGVKGLIPFSILLVQGSLVKGTRKKTIFTDRKMSTMYWLLYTRGGYQIHSRVLFGNIWYRQSLPLKPELNFSAQRCLTRIFTGDLSSWTMHFVNICVKNQQIHQLFIQFINYVW
jgi:hypothetical protein